MVVCSCFPRKYCVYPASTGTFLAATQNAWDSTCDTVHLFVCCKQTRFNMQQRVQKSLEGRGAYLFQLPNSGLQVLQNKFHEFPSCQTSHLCLTSLSDVSVVKWTCGREHPSCLLSYCKTSNNTMSKHKHLNSWTVSFSISVIPCVVSWHVQETFCGCKHQALSL